MRIRTVRLLGQISQGICFALSILPAGFVVEEGADCTEVLGITKYEPPIPACLNGIAKGKFPSYIPKTDETRVQTLQQVLDTFKSEPCYITEKLDGTSVTYYLKDGEFGVCSRNYELEEDSENSLWKVARELFIEQKLRSLGENIALQGELIGEGIQGNKLKLRGQTVRFFTAYAIDKAEYLNFNEFQELLGQLDLPMVPVLNVRYHLENDIEAIVRMATVKSQLLEEVWAEGIVIRSHSAIQGTSLSGENFFYNRLSFKAINPEFLLKFGE